MSRVPRTTSDCWVPTLPPGFRQEVGRGEPEIGCKARNRLPGTQGLLASVMRPLCVLLVLHATASAQTFHNPLNPDHGSDPWLQYYKGTNYLTATTWSGSAATGITMKHGHTIAELSAATPVPIWSDTTASRCCNVWAPEFHLLDRKSTRLNSSHVSES